MGPNQKRPRTCEMFSVDTFVPESRVSVDTFVPACRPPRRLLPATVPPSLPWRPGRPAPQGSDQLAQSLCIHWRPAALPSGRGRASGASCFARSACFGGVASKSRRARAWIYHVLRRRAICPYLQRRAIHTRLRTARARCSQDARA